VLLEFKPFPFDGWAILFLWSHGAAVCEEFLRVADDVFLEHRDVALRGFQVHVT
jgi:hypothetical protein